MQNNRGLIIVLNIEKLLKDRMEYPLLPNEDKLLHFITNIKEDTFYFISIDKHIKKLSYQTNYHISALFDLANPFGNTDIRFCLVKMTKNISEHIKTSVYDNKLSMGRIDRETWKYPQWKLKENISTSYQSYLQALEQWENNEELPKNTKDYSFNVIDLKNFNKDILNPYFYTKSLETLKKNLHKEKTINLTEIATIIRPKKKLTNKGKVLTAKDFKYPIDYKSIIVKDATDIELRKGDIIIKGIGEFKSFLINEHPLEKIYAGSNDFIVRVTDEKYAPEYLQMCFNSETYQNLMRTLSVGTAIPFYNMKTISELKIIVPVNDKNYYISLFNYQLSPLENKDGYRNLLLNKPKLKDFETTFQLEQIRKLSNNYNQQVQEVFDNDMKEVEACFNAKAYKATLILCGSVLEAFLLDWLNELQPEEKWLEKDWIYDKKNKKDVHVGLNDYINKINKIKKPNWMNEAGKAHEIQKQRNLVHAKLCLKDDLSINKELCKKVISYLHEVIYTRGTV